MLRGTHSRQHPNRSPLLLATALLLLLAPMAVSAEPSVGDPAPDFSLRGSDGELHSLQAILASGKQGVVLAWFPKAFTPG
jgi:hypothetical protein